MALKNLFDMVKADRYTQDGREELIKAQKECTEDVKYNIGDISQKTGLMKTPNGWVEPPKGRVAGKRAVEAKGKEVQRQMKHDDLVSRMAEEERIWNKNHPDKAHYNYNPKPTEKKTESKPASQSESKTPAEIIKEKGVNKIKHIQKNHPYATEEDINSWIKEEFSPADAERIFNEKKNYNGMFSPNDDKLTNSFNQWYKRNRNKKWYAETHAKDSAPRVLTGDTRIRVRK